MSQEIVLLVGDDPTALPPELEWQLSDKRFMRWVEADVKKAENLPDGIKAVVFCNKPLSAASARKLKGLTTANRGLKLFEAYHAQQVHEQAVTALRALGEAIPRVQTDGGEPANNQPRAETITLAPVISEEAADGEMVLRIPVERVRAFKNQPREYFDEESLTRLSRSIAKAGQVQPAIVKKLEDNPDHDYELIDGERRWRACQLAGVGYLRAVVETVADEGKQHRRSAIANFGREDHQPMETARALARTQADENYTLADLADIFARSIGWVQQHLNLLKLDPAVQSLLNPKFEIKRQLKPAIALSLVGYTPEVQLEVATKSISNGWTRREATKYLRERMKQGAIVRAGVRPRKPSDDVSLFEGFRSLMDDRLAVLVSIPANSFASVLKSRGPQVRRAMLVDIKNWQKKLQIIHDTIAGIQLEK